MNDQTLLYWGMIVTLFLFFAFLLTAQQLFENYMDRQDEERLNRNGDSEG